MKKTGLIAFVGGVIFLFVLMSCNIGGTPTTGSFQLYVSGSAVNAGDVVTFLPTQVNTTSGIILSIKNTGKNDITFTPSTAIAFTGPDASEFAVQTAPPDIPLSPGYAVTFAIGFTPTAHATASATATLTGDCNDKELTVSFVLAGNGGTPVATVTDMNTNTPMVSASNGADFGDASVHAQTYPTQVTHTFSVKNTGDAELILSGTAGVSIDGNGDSANFSVTSPPPLTQIIPSSGPGFFGSYPATFIAPNGVVTFDLTFSAITGDGTEKDGSATISSNSGYFVILLKGMDDY